MAGIYPEAENSPVCFALSHDVEEFIRNFRNNQCDWMNNSSLEVILESKIRWLSDNKIGWAEKEHTHKKWNTCILVAQYMTQPINYYDLKRFLVHCKLFDDTVVVQMSKLVNQDYMYHIRIWVECWQFIFVLHIFDISVIVVCGST